MSNTKKFFQTDITGPYNNILLLSTLFGSIIIFSTSLSEFNKIQYKKYPKFLVLFNGIIMSISGSIFLYSSYQSIKKINTIKS